MVVLVQIPICSKYKTHLGTLCLNAMTCYDILYDNSQMPMIFPLALSISTHEYKLTVHDIVPLYSQFMMVTYWYQCIKLQKKYHIINTISTSYSKYGVHITCSTYPHTSHIIFPYMVYTWWLNIPIINPIGVYLHTIHVINMM